ncbi:MAG: hypothetical protein ABMA02_12340 [Saprospiraceae bacterium]
MIYNTNEYRTEKQKAAFVRIWERLRRRGMVFFLLRSMAILVLLFGAAELFDPLFRSDPFLAETWTAWAAEHGIGNFLVPILIAGLVVGIILWYCNEELYRNFKINKP